MRGACSRKLSSAERWSNPTNGVRGYKGTGENETPHVALNGTQAKALLDAVDRSTPLGLRDYALLMLLIRTGIRRAEAAALTLGDFRVEQGHNVLTIRHGKVDKRRKAKVPVDVIRAITEYLEATGLKDAGNTAPLFTGFRKGKGQSKQAAPGAAAVVVERVALSDKAIERIVKGYTARVGITGLTPHGLRASFITLALENGAKLQQIQYAAGHADTRITERRKFNLG